MMSIARVRPLLLAAALAGGLSAGPAAQVAVRDSGISTDSLMETVRVLASPAFEGRGTATPGGARARAWIVERFRQIGLPPAGAAFEIPFTFTTKANPAAMEGVNVAALCRGTGAADAGVVVISAHYDHVGVRDGAIYHGADDNASGVAVLLELARRCRQSPWRHDVVFAAFDAEEHGLRGARAFVASPPVPSSRIALNVNLDMVSRSAAREIYVAGTYHRPALKAVLDPVAARAPVRVLFGHDRPKEIAKGQDDWTQLSDHGAFHAAGIPFVYFGVEDHADYHKPTDTADKIEPAFFGQVAATILDAVTALDRALPLD